MKATNLLVICFIIFCTTMPAAEFHSTTEGGLWSVPATWNTTSTPGPDDDVYIHGRVFVSNHSCTNLYVVGSEALIQPQSGAHASITIYGNLQNSGWMCNNSGYRLTVNLYGDLTIGYYFVPQTFNWLGSGDRYLSCPYPYGIRTLGTTTIANTIENIYATGDVYFGTYESNVQLITGNGQLATVNLFDPETRATHNLTSQSCKLDYLKILGDGNSEFNFNNASSLSGVYMQNCLLQDLVTTGTHSLAANNTLLNISNNGIIQNDQGNYSVNINGDFVNNGTVQRHPSGYTFTVNAYDSVYNVGTWNNVKLVLQGDDAQSICFPLGHAFTNSEMNDATPSVGVYAVSDLYFQDTTLNLGNGILYLNPGGYDLYFSNSLLKNTAVVSTLSSVLNMENTSRLEGASFQSITTNGTILLQSSISISGDLLNNGTIKDYGGSFALNVSGNITNNGTIRNEPYNLTVNASGNVVNNGVWSNYKLNLNGTASQMISFPAGFAFTGPNFTDSNAASAITTNNDLHFTGTTIDTNLAPWQLSSGGWDIVLSNCILRDAVIQSDENTVLNMSNGGYIDNCSFQSVTTNGTVGFYSSTPFSGNLVNLGLVQPYDGSRILTINGNISNYGTIANSNYNLTINAGANVYNYGTISIYNLNLDSANGQLIFFPEEHPFSGANFTDSNSSSAISSNADLYFVNTTIDLNNSIMQLSEACGLVLNNCILRDAIVHSDESNTLNMYNGGYINNCSFQALTTTGLVNLYTDTTFSGNLHNLGTVQNYDGSRYLYVQGNLNNEGTIQKHVSGYNFYVHISQNLNNSGIISSSSLSFIGAADQHLNNTGTIGVANITDSNNASAVILDTNLALTNTTIDMNNASLVLNTGSRTGKTLSLNGGALTEAVVVGGGGAKLNLSNLAYLNLVSIDDIIFEGTVMIGDGVSVNNLSNYAEVKNWQYSGSTTLTINGRLDNHETGSITNNNYNLYLNIYGDLYNYGVMRNNSVTFKSASNQYLYQSATADTIRCNSLQKTVATGNVIMLSHLRLRGCYISLGGRSLVMQNGRASYNLSMYGGYIQSTVLDADNYSILNLSNGAYLNELTCCGNLTFEGNVDIIGNFYVNNLINNATTRNYPGYTAYLNVYQRLDNYGSLAYTGYSFYLKLHGDFYDYGTVTTSLIYFMGTGNQNIYQAPTADAIRATGLTKNISGGDVTMLSDLNLAGCYISLNNRSLIMQSGSTDHTLTMSGAYISSTVLASPGIATLNCNNGTYLNGISGGNFIWQGTINMIGTCNFGSITNHAYVRNQSGWTVYLNLNGNLMNHGTFFSDGYPLYLYVSGHLSNLGTLANRRVYLNGTSDQNVQLNGTETIDYLTINSGIGSAQWFHNGIYSGITGTTLDLAMTSPHLNGYWQPYNVANQTWGRTVTFIAGGALDAPANLLISVNDGTLLLQWNQVTGAVFYKVWSSDNPDSGFTVLAPNVTDGNPGDGIVQFNTPIDADRRFFKVTAN